MRRAAAIMAEVAESLLIADSLFKLLCVERVCSWLHGCEHIPLNTHLAVTCDGLAPTLLLTEPELFQDDLQEGEGCATKSQVKAKETS